MKFTFSLASIIYVGWDRMGGGVCR